EEVESDRPEARTVAERRDELEAPHGRRARLRDTPRLGEAAHFLRAAVPPGEDADVGLVDPEAVDAARFRVQARDAAVVLRPAVDADDVRAADRDRLARAEPERLRAEGGRRRPERDGEESEAACRSASHRP